MKVRSRDRNGADFRRFSKGFAARFIAGST